MAGTETMSDAKLDAGSAQLAGRKRGHAHRQSAAAPSPAGQGMGPEGLQPTPLSHQTAQESR